VHVSDQRHGTRPLWVAVALLAGVIAPAGAAVASVPPDDEPPPNAARFVPVEPCRLLDTRGADHNNPAAPPLAGATVEIDVAGQCGVMPSAVAAALTVTVVDPAVAGYATVFPAGAERPNVSTVNYRAGQTVANLQLARLADGDVDVFTLASGHLVVDITGYFETPSGDPSDIRRGRFVALPGGRVADTRTTGRPAENGVVRVDTGPAGVPDDAAAVAVNLTTDTALGADYFTVYPAGSPRPTASVLNVDRPGQARAAAAIVPVDDAQFDVFTRFGNHVIVDLLGYFTGPSADASGDGLFVPVDPFRLVDSRGPAGPHGGPRLWDNGGREFPIPEAALDAPAGSVAALAVNATATATEDAGWVALAAAGVPVPGTSTVNYPAPQQTVANSAIVGVSDRGIQARALASTHLVLDVTGWFTGTPADPVAEPPANPLPPPRKVTIVGDSVLAGIRWNGASSGLQGFVPIDETHSCRRLVQPSCRGREGYRPISALPYIQNLPVPAGPEDILVIGLGYDDWHTNFGNEFDQVVSAARQKGFHHIAWMTLRTGVNYQFSGVAAGTNYAAMNATLLSKLATGDYPDVRVWDFDGYTHAATSDAAGWFYSDGVHLRPLGAWAIADWISRHVAAFDERPCPQPWRPGQPVDDPCLNPDSVVAGRGYPDIAGLYVNQ
jgi:hypothetical protein